MGFYTLCSCHEQVLFSKSAQDKIHQLADNPGTNDEANRAAHLLLNAMNVINQVGMQDSREDRYYYGWY